MNQSEHMRKEISLIIRFILGLTFILSGILKGIDPMGLAYKIEEFLVYISLENWIYLSKALSVTVCSAELFIGVTLLLGIEKRMVGRFTFIVMLFFTLLTFYLYLKPDVLSDCGCFGEAFHLSHTLTFTKNLVLLLLSIINLWTTPSNKINHPYKKESFLFMLAVLVYCLSIPLHSLLKLPTFDFLPYTNGTDLTDNSSFMIFDDSLNIVTSNYISRDKNTLLIISRHPEKLANNQDKIFQAICSFGDDSLNKIFIGNQNSMEIVDVLPTLLQYDINIYQSDEVLLKSLLRCDNGIVLLQKGMIKGKWKISSFINRVQFTIDGIIRNMVINQCFFVSWVLFGIISLIFGKWKLLSK